MCEGIVRDKNEMTDEELMIQIGLARIAWVQRNMPVLEQIKLHFKESQPFAGLCIGMCLHLEPKTINLGLTLLAGGAKVVMAGCNPLSTQDDAVAGGRQQGLIIFGKTGESTEEYYCNLEMLCKYNPNIVIDDGADLIEMIHVHYPELAEKIIGGCEETTTGIHRLISMANEEVLKFPVMDINDAKMKHLFDNRYGTGQSVFNSIMQATNIVIASKTVVVAGYGWCGRGIAMRGNGLGANIIVTEVDPVKANEALMDGYRVMPMCDAVEEADIIITATGCKDVVAGDNVIPNIKDNCILCNAGHFDVEINKGDLDRWSLPLKHELTPDITEYTMLDGKCVYLLAEGRLVNLATSEGNGHPAEIMDTSFALQALCTQWLVHNVEALENRVVFAPADMDDWIAIEKLDAKGVEIDALTDDQMNYMENWDVGT